MGRFLRFAVAARVAAGRGFPVDFDGDVGFGCADLGVAGFAPVGLWALDFFS